MGHCHAPPLVPSRGRTLPRSCDTKLHRYSPPNGKSLPLKAWTNALNPALAPLPPKVCWSSKLCAKLSIRISIYMPKHRALKAWACLPQVGISPNTCRQPCPMMPNPAGLSSNATKRKLRPRIHRSKAKRQTLLRTGPASQMNWYRKPPKDQTKQTKKRQQSRTRWLKRAKPCSRLP